MLDRPHNARPSQSKFTQIQATQAFVDQTYSERSNNILNMSHINKTSVYPCSRMVSLCLSMLFLMLSISCLSLRVKSFSAVQFRVSTSFFTSVSNAFQSRKEGGGPPLATRLATISTGLKVAILNMKSGINGGTTRKQCISFSGNDLCKKFPSSCS